MISNELFVTVFLFISLLNIKIEAIAIKCDYRKHSSGCEVGATCDDKLKHCVCRAGYATMANGVCLELRSINETCVSSVQCRTMRSSCLADDSDYSKWKCQCIHGYWFDKQTRRCVQKKFYADVCQLDIECRAGLICTADQNNGLHCQCSDNDVYNSTTNECQNANKTDCPDGQQWSAHSNACENVDLHYSKRNDNQVMENANAIIKNNKLLRPPSHWTNTNDSKDSDTDEKILEIILEISFLIVCLLAYQACSKACCPDDNDDDMDGKSDEESMIATTPRSKHRRVRKVFCKNRTNSTQRLISTPIHKYKNIIVKFDDSNKASCYNCKIYQEVYSSDAKCKVCRSLLVDDSASCGDGKTALLPLPPYKLKPIRRSEEVGVPPHLKAPYLNNQPFWLK